jgi:predicted phosphodiesterase
MPTVHKRTLVIGDIHVPYHNYVGVLLMLEYAQKLNIDSILINGDFMDFHGLSKFQHDPRKRTFKQEIEAGNQMLDVLQRAFPSVKIFYKLGNHDERYENFLMNKAPELLDLDVFRFENNFNLLARGIELVRDQRIIYFGKLPVLHGHEVGMKSISVNPARTLFLKTNHSSICSHLHRTSQHSDPRLDGHIVSCWSTGHLCEEHPQYARNNKWNLGFAFVEYDKEIFEVSNFKIIDNKVFRS